MVQHLSKQSFLSPILQVRRWRYKKAKALADSQHQGQSWESRCYLSSQRKQCSFQHKHAQSWSMFRVGLGKLLKNFGKNRSPVFKEREIGSKSEKNK